MRLASFAGTNGLVRLGAVTDKGLIDLRTAARNMGVAADAFADIISFLATGESAVGEAQRLIAGPPQGSLVAMNGIRLLPPVPKPGKIIAIGLNYRDHQIESGAKEAPKSPMVFAKFTTSIAAAEDPIVIPVGDPQVDSRTECAELRCWLHAIERCIGARLAIRGQAVGARKILRHILPDGTLPDDNG